MLIYKSPYERRTLNGKRSGKIPISSAGLFGLFVNEWSNASFIALINFSFFRKQISNYMVNLIFKNPAILEPWFYPFQD